MELAGDHRALDLSRRAIHGAVDVLDRDLLEGDRGDVLGAVHVAHLGMGGHDHLRRSLTACQPAPKEAVDETVPGVVVDVLAEVPDGAVVGLRVVVEGDFLDAAVEIGAVLRHGRLDGLARAPFDQPGIGQQGGLRMEGLSLDDPPKTTDWRSLTGKSGFVISVGLEKVGAWMSTRSLPGASGRSARPADSSCASVGCGMAFGALALESLIAAAAAGCEGGGRDGCGNSGRCSVRPHGAASSDDPVKGM